MTTQVKWDGSADLHRRKTEPVENYSEATSTQLDDFIHLIGDGWATEFFDLGVAGKHSKLLDLIERCEADLKKELTTLVDTLAKEVIGQDEDWSIHNGVVNMDDVTNQHIKVRKQLRTEQLGCLSQLLNRGGDGASSRINPSVRTDTHNGKESSA